MNNEIDKHSERNDSENDGEENNVEQIRKDDFLFIGIPVQFRYHIKEKAEKDNHIGYEGC